MAGARAHAAVAYADSIAALRLLRRTALLASALMLIVVAASAYLRLRHAGAPCADASACGEADALIVLARTAHRVAAGGVAVLIVALIVITRGQPRLRGHARLAGGALAIAIALALLGTGMSAFAPGNTPSAVIVGNLAGGFALLALMATSWAGASAQIADAHRWNVPASVRRMLVLSVVIAGIAVALGGLASDGIAGARSAHRFAGWVLVALVGTLLVMSRRAPRPWCAWRPLVNLLLMAQVLLGVAQAHVAPSLAMTLAHNLAAAALVAALAATTYRAYVVDT